MMEVESTEPTVTVSRTEAERRTARIRGKLADALDDLVEAFFDGVHTALGYESWDEYVAGEFGDLRFKVAAVERGERVRELRGRGMPVKVAADLFGVTERTVKRDSVGGQMSPSEDLSEDAAQALNESMKGAIRGMVDARRNIVSALRQHPDLTIPENVEPPKINDVVVELIAAEASHTTLLMAMVERTKALKVAEGARRDRITKALLADAEAAGRLSARKTAVHHAAKFLGRSDEVESVAAGMGLHWSEDEGHYINEGIEGAE